MKETLYTQNDLKGEALQHARAESKSWKGGRARKLIWGIRLVQGRNGSESATLVISWTDNIGEHTGTVKI